MMNRTLLRSLAVLAVAVAAFGAMGVLSQLSAADAPASAPNQSASQDKPKDASPKTGTIEGVITYKADAERPWRYARYYVKDRKTGALAEAVVALAGDALKDTKPASKPATTKVDQKDFQFVPETVVIREGDTVKFTNSDNAVHNVQTVSKLGSFNVNLAAGGEHSETFKQAGGIQQPFRIGCLYHGGMRAWIFVFDHPFFQLTQADGRFQLPDVPEGSYTLEVAHPAGQLSESRKIEVKAGQTTRVDIVLSPDNKPHAKDD